MCIFFENIGKNITSHFKNHFLGDGGGGVVKIIKYTLCNILCKLQKKNPVQLVWEIKYIHYERDLSIPKQICYAKKKNFRAHDDARAFKMV